ncbi:MAG: hypothetical protein FWE57_03965 [Chitinispirillia bacterium]|nr:hypothetical protein [Chitinispirillia bacterium]
MAVLFFMIIDVCKNRRFHKIGSSFCLLALLLCGCARVSDHCSDHKPFDRRSQFCHDGEPYLKCSGYKFDTTENCDDICDDWKITTRATCHAAGEKTRTCPGKHIDTVKIAQLTGHMCFTDERGDTVLYGTVIIGGVKWMTENLNYVTANDSSWCYGNDLSNCKNYGRLYTWAAARNACPEQWRLSTNSDWEKLVAEAGGSAGAALKSSALWNGTDELDFFAMPGGSRNNYDVFGDIGSLGYWWSGTEGSEDNTAYYWSMSSDIDDVNKFTAGKNRGFSVRCVQE